MAESVQTTGKRKTAIARVSVLPGEGNIVVNKKRSLKEYFPREAHQQAALRPLSVTDRLSHYDVKVTVRGGGALVDLEEDLRPLLKKAGLLTRDPRIVERKKYGRHKARRSPQYSKR